MTKTVMKTYIKISDLVGDVQLVRNEGCVSFASDLSLPFVEDRVEMITETSSSMIFDANE